jgi:uncharacterized protein (DUF1697 family)
MNAKMAELKACLEAAGFSAVKTILSSGNVVFRARASSLPALERKLEAAMSSGLGRTFLTIVRPLDLLDELLASDPFAPFRLLPGSKRVVTFLRDAPPARLTLPISVDGARILAVKNNAVFTAYVPHPRGPVFMTLIEKTFGTAATTRTWDTLEKVAGTRRTGVNSRAIDRGMKRLRGSGD